MDFKISSPVLPMLFTPDGYQLVVMPMLTDKAQAQVKAKAKAEPVAESQPKATKHSRAKQPVTA